MSDGNGNGLALECLPSGRGTTATITARLNDDVLACETLNLAKPKQRADFASRFIMKGGSPQALQVLLGHSSLRMTEKYVRLGKDYLDQVAQLLDAEVRVVTNWSPGDGEAAA